MKRSDHDNSTLQKTLTRRALLFGGIQLGVVGSLIWRMYNMQVTNAERFRLLAEENRINTHLLPPARGLIYDRQGLLIAQNEQNYKITLIREGAQDLDATLARLAALVGLSDAQIRKVKEDIYRRPSFVPVTVAERLSWEQLARVNINAPALPGVSAEVGLSRAYPQRENLAHVIGYVGPVSDYYLSRTNDDDPLLQIPKFQIGKTGVEQKLEQALRGSAGNKQVEVNAIGRVMRELGRQEGQQGANVRLTIDSSLQAYVQARLGDDSASAVVMDVENGDVLAIASSPSFNPNLFVRGISVKDWRGLNENKYRPLAAKAIQGVYPPGSTFKMVTALAALEAGVITPEETVYCRGYMDISGTKFHCWKRSGHGNINLHESLKQSCDCYYYELAQRVGIDNISNMAKKFGLGIRHDLPLSAVASGLAPNREWKKKVRDQEWRVGDTVNASIGQGDVLASPLQLAVMTARLATGQAIEPRLILSVDGLEQEVASGGDMGVNKNMLRRIRAAMTAVSNHKRGTAYKARSLGQELRIAGKTGTSQVRRITIEERARGVRRNADLPWERRDHALFVNFAPADNPKYAVAVVVEHGGSGSQAAAPIGRDITLRALHEGEPPLSAYPRAMRSRIRSQQEQIAARIAAVLSSDDGSNI